MYLPITCKSACATLFEWLIPWCTSANLSKISWNLLPTSAPSRITFCWLDSGISAHSRVWRAFRGAEVKSSITFGCIVETHTMLCYNTVRHACIVNKAYCIKVYYGLGYWHKLNYVPDNIYVRDFLQRPSHDRLGVLPCDASEHRQGNQRQVQIQREGQRQHFPVKNNSDSGK